MVNANRFLGDSHMARRGRKNFEPVSASQGGGHVDPRVGDLTVGDYANGVPNIRLSEMFKSMARQLIWLIPLGLLGCALAFYLTKDLKRVYTGDGRIMVQLGEEYVYNPVGGAANGNGLMTTIDTITLTEAALMKNGTVIESVLGQMTPDRQSQDRFNKEAFAKIRNAGSERARQDAVMELRRSVEESYVVMPRPKSSIIDVVFKHEDPDVAVQTTNAFIDEYLSFRRQVFVEGSSELITERREATEAQLNANERAIARFLARNNVADFESEQTGLRKRTEDLKASLNTTRASVAETEAALAQVEDRMRATSPTIDLYVDDRTAQRISQAELELRQLMAKYLPTSDPVRQKQTELNELRALQSSYGGKASGGRRVGPNPEHQALATQRNTLAATADSLREREFALQGQLNSADSKIRKLTSLTPEYQNLLRERETLNTRLTSYNAKEQEALIDAAQAETQAENVIVISRAEYANKGRNTRLVMWALGTLGFGIVLGFFALIRVFLDPRLYVEAGASRRSNHMPMQEQDIPVMAPEFDPIPEPIPTYEPIAPAYDNPYDQSAATPLPAENYGVSPDAYPSVAQSGYPAGQYTAQASSTAVHGYSPATGYDPSAYVQFDSSGEVHSMQHSAAPLNQQPTAGHPLATQPTVGQADLDHPPMAFQSNAALDISSNPYLNGDVQAGSIEGATQYDEYGRPISPLG
ncbi:hypothetical protein GCM10011309_11070 [Litorimonas cladophorae]|uniref:Lipopolysaccharide biosynthesis protein n=2 Tax=Litorimonas cladophorae TaxID=1220491 RepID=A0A918KGP4_9PROT|nr:hypothetical protein GCM10011309_11070 [Litorimonas cladophorae]